MHHKMKQRQSPLKDQASAYIAVAQAIAERRRKAALLSLAQHWFRLARLAERDHSQSSNPVGRIARRDHSDRGDAN